MPTVSTATDSTTGRTPAMTDTSQTYMAKRSIVIAGHRTSISLEDAFWRALREIAVTRALSVASLVAEIDSQRGGANLSSAIRVFVLHQAQATDRREANQLTLQ